MGPTPPDAAPGGGEGPRSHRTSWHAWPPTTTSAYASRWRRTIRTPRRTFCCAASWSTPAPSAHLLSRPNFPTAGPAAWADHEDPEVRALAARDPETVPAVVERLTKDPDPAVRAASARHPNLPQSRLAQLLDDEELAHAAAANPALDEDVVRRLVRTLGDR